MFFAYIDPGSSMLLWQFLLSAATGIFILFRSGRKRAVKAIDWIRNRFRSTAGHSSEKKK